VADTAHRHTTAAAVPTSQCGIIDRVLIADIDTSIHGLTGHVAPIDELMRLLAAYLVFGAVLVLALLWFHRNGLRAGLAVGIGAVVALLIGQVLSSVFPESRPFVVDHFTPLIAHPADGSFPSDHLLVLGALVGGCLPASRRLAAVAAVMALLVAVARVYVGIHHPIDVIAGFLIGAACGLAAWAALGAVRGLIDRLDEVLRHHRLRPIRWDGGEPTE
jgi:undecaprenyl-diphosphatase